MMKNNITEVPVIDKSSIEQRPLGVLTLDEIQSIISRENFKKQFTSSLAQELKTLHTEQSIEVAEGYSIKEIIVPKSLIGKSLKETQIRNHYNIEVLMIKKNRKNSSGIENGIIITAEPNYVFEEDDKLVLFGRSDNIRKFELMS